MAVVATPRSHRSEPGRCAQELSSRRAGAVDIHGLPFFNLLAVRRWCRAGGPARHHLLTDVYLVSNTATVRAGTVNVPVAESCVAVFTTASAPAAWTGWSA